MDSLIKKKKEDEEDEVPPINWVPNEILIIILSQLDPKTMMIVVPQVCKFWRSMCQELIGVHLDFRWWVKKNVPLEVLAGWVNLSDDDGRWKSGLCALFPGSTSVTLMSLQEIEDKHVKVLSDTCHRLTRVDFERCDNLTDTAVLKLADK